VALDALEPMPEACALKLGSSEGWPLALPALLLLPAAEALPSELTLPLPLLL